jgi:hypothetical protein
VKHSPVTSRALHGAPPTGLSVSRGAVPILGPLTTSDMSGAGGPANQWDRLIAAARRRGDEAAAVQLQADRAKTCLAFGIQEAVWIATPSQAAMFGLRSAAARNGVSILDLTVTKRADGSAGIAA